MQPYESSGIQGLTESARGYCFASRCVLFNFRGCAADGHPENTPAINLPSAGNDEKTTWG